MNPFENLPTNWHEIPPLHEVAERTEKAFHIPYFGAVAWHYGPWDLVGGSALVLFLASALGLFRKGTDLDGDSD